MSTRISAIPRASVSSLLLLLISLLVSTPSMAAPERAEYESVASLPSEGVPHVIDVALLAEYARVLEPSRLSNLGNIGVFAFRARSQLGKTVTYCVGLDGEIGGSDRGAVYGLTAYPIGVGGRWGAGNTISLCGGSGFDGMVGAVPLAARFPAELAIAFSVGPIRPVAWARPSWIAGAASRRQGSSISFVDELELGLLVRLSPQHRYWAESNAGGGFAVGISYRELMETRFVALAIGFNLVGAQ